jgi:hypothetical protein
MYLDDLLTTLDHRTRSSSQIRLPTLARAARLDRVLETHTVILSRVVWHLGKDHIAITAQQLIHPNVLVAHTPDRGWSRYLCLSQRRLLYFDAPAPPNIRPQVEAGKE